MADSNSIGKYPIVDTELRANKYYYLNKFFPPKTTL